MGRWWLPARSARAELTGERYFGIARGADELEGAFAVRRHVFCEEQGVSEADEFDEHDADAIHIVGVEDGVVVGTCRLVLGPLHCRLGRLAVDARRRGSGAGRRLLAAAEQAARGRGARELVVHAQVAAQPFYERRWFVAEGDVFEEDGIDHVRMRKTIYRD